MMTHGHLNLPHLRPVLSNHEDPIEALRAEDERIRQEYERRQRETDSVLERIRAEIRVQRGLSGRNE